MASSSRKSATILAVDIGGSGLKAALVDRRGRMRTERVRVKIPHPSSPPAVLHALARLVRSLPIDDRVAGVAVGFPGVVRKGIVYTAPNLGTDPWRRFDLAAALTDLWKKPVRIINDADMQALGASRGKGVEVVITLGTGFGSAILVDGELALHLELSQIPFRKGETYDEQLGDKGRRKAGNKKWNRRVARAVKALRALTQFDALYIGGGNSRHVKIRLPRDVRRIANEYGLKGGAVLWRDRFNA